MKRHWITTFVTLFVMALLAGTLVAEETKDRPKRGDKAEGRKRAGRRHGRHGRMPDIGLTAAQKKEIEGIRKTALAKAKDAEGKDRRAIIEKMKEDIHGVFTEEQLAKLKKLREKRGPGGDRPDLGLTDEQKEKMAAIRKATKAKMKDAKGEDRKAIIEGMRKQIAAILTEEQLEKFKKAHQGGRRGREPGGPPDIGLSDDQKSQVEDIRKKALAAAKDAKGEDRKAIFEKMKKDIHALFTDEQIKKLKELKKKHRDGPRGKGKGRGDRKGRRGGGDKKGRKGGGDKKRPAAE